MRAAAKVGCCLLLAASGDLYAQAYVYGFAARINDTEISNYTLDRNFEEYLRENDVNVAAIRYPERVRAMKQETLGLLIDQELLWQAAQARGTLAKEEEVNQVLEEMRAQYRSEELFLRTLTDEGYTQQSYREHLQRLVSARKYQDEVAADVEISDADIHTFYIENPDSFQMPATVRARHILVTVDPAAGEAAIQAAWDEMAEVVDQLAMGADFATLASVHSDDSSAAQGGDLGYFPRSQMVEPFENAAFSLRPGELSDVVETRFGLHLIKVEDRRDAELLPEDLARDQVRTHLRQLRRQEALDEELANLRAAAEIVIP